MTFAIQSAIQRKLSLPFSKICPIGGGSINAAYRIDSGIKQFFCKINSASKFPQLFIKEKNGLLLIGQQNLTAVPSVVDYFEHEGLQILLLEWINEGERNDAFWKRFGEQLAKLHQITHDSFGLGENNYIGSVSQSNKQHTRWTSFFKEERLQPMVTKCFEKNLLSALHQKQFKKLFAELPTIFEDERPSLLHGDLWNGNFMCNRAGQPVLIDPAVYYGHRSMDMAMTTLFGGFHPKFYEAYHYHFQLPPNYSEQWKACNLYPLLIHLYLFGKGYLPQIENTLKHFT